MYQSVDSIEIGELGGVVMEGGGRHFGFWRASLCFCVPLADSSESLDACGRPCALSTFKFSLGSAGGARGCMPEFGVSFASSCRGFARLSELSVVHCEFHFALLRCANAGSYFTAGSK